MPVPAGARVAVRKLGLEGDEIGDRVHHGGRFQAVYAYADEDAAWWTAQDGRPALGEAGVWGENLRVRGVECSRAVVGTVWRVRPAAPAPEADPGPHAASGARLVVTSPRVPCFKLGIRMGDPTMVKRFARAGRPGCYLKVLAEGDVGPGDALEVEHVPGHGVTVAALLHGALFDPPSLAAAEPAWDDLAPGWRDQVDAQLR